MHAWYSPMHAWYLGRGLGDLLERSVGCGDAVPVGLDDLKKKVEEEGGKRNQA